MKKVLNYNFHDIVRMRISIENYNPFLSKTLEQKFAHYAVAGLSGKPDDIDVYIGKFSPDLRGASILDECYYIKKDYIFRRHTHKIARWKVAIDGLEKEHTTLRIESNAPGWWVFPGGTIYSILMFKLATRGYVMLHASSVSRDEKAYIFTGRSGTGKTITVFNLLKRGFSYLGDDTTILGRNRVFSFIKPLNIRFTYDVKGILGLKFDARERVLIFLKNILRIVSMGYINLFTKADIRDSFPDRLGSKGSLEKLFFMAQSNNFCIRESQNKDMLTKQMVVNTEFESEELSGYLLAYTHVFPEAESASFWNGVREIIKENVKDKLCYSIDMPKRYSLGNFDLLLERVNE